MIFDPSQCIANRGSGLSYVMCNVSYSRHSLSNGLSQSLKQSSDHRAHSAIMTDDMRSCGHGLDIEVDKNSFPRARTIVNGTSAVQRTTMQKGSILTPKCNGIYIDNVRYSRTGVCFPRPC